MQSIDLEKKLCLNQFTSAAALTSAASETKRTDGTPVVGCICESRAVNGHHVNWTESESFEAAVKLVATGWDKRPDLGKIASNIAIQTAAENLAAVVIVHSVAGAFPNVGEFLAGNPECMARYEMMHSPKVIRLGFSINALSDIKTDQFERRGAVTMALVERLTLEGYQVELIALAASKARSGERQITSVRIKEASQFLDEDSLAFWACHPSAFRRMGFAILERMPAGYAKAFGAGTGGTYGQSIYDRREVESMAAHLRLDVLISPDMNSDMSTDAAAAKFLDSIAKEVEGCA